MLTPPLLPIVTNSDSGNSLDISLRSNRNTRIWRASLVPQAVLFLILQGFTAENHMTNTIITKYIYHALIEALSAHVIHINLSTIFYTHVQHSPTNAIYRKYYVIMKQKKVKGNEFKPFIHDMTQILSLIHISEPTRPP